MWNKIKNLCTVFKRLSASETISNWRLTRIQELEDSTRNARFDEALEKTNEKHAETLKELSEE